MKMTRREAMSLMVGGGLVLPAITNGDEPELDDLPEPALPATHPFPELYPFQMAPWCSEQFDGVLQLHPADKHTPGLLLKNIQLVVTWRQGWRTKETYLSPDVYQTTLTAERAIAPSAVFSTFMKRTGDVTNAAINMGCLRLVGKDESTLVNHLVMTQVGVMMTADGVIRADGIGFIGNIGRNVIEIATAFEQLELYRV